MRLTSSSENVVILKTTKSNSLVGSQFNKNSKRTIWNKNLRFNTFFNLTWNCKLVYV